MRGSRTFSPGIAPEPRARRCCSVKLPTRADTVASVSPMRVVSSDSKRKTHPAVADGSTPEFTLSSANCSKRFPAIAPCRSSARCFHPGSAKGCTALKPAVDLSTSEYRKRTPPRGGFSPPKPKSDAILTEFLGSLEAAGKAHRRFPGAAPFDGVLFRDSRPVHAGLNPALIESAIKHRNAFFQTFAPCLRKSRRRIFY